MKSINQISAEALLAWGGLCLFLTVGVLYVLSLRQESLSLGQCEPGLSHYECGQYFFNHDEDPAGPYDLRVADQYFDAAIANEEHLILALYQSGRVDFIEGRFSEALEKFDRHVEINGDTIPNVYYMIGLTNAYYARETNDPARWVAAEDGFKAFLALDPQNAWGHVDLSWVYFAQGKYAEMYALLDGVIEQYPNNPWLLNMYGLAILNTSADRALAHEYLEQAHAAATKLTVRDWGVSYPGNNPNDWAQGLREFQAAVANNLALTE